MPEGRSQGHCNLAESAEDLRPLHRLCRDGRFYDVERWIAAGKPLQVAPEAIGKGTRPKTALQIALESGQHSLALLLLRSGYRLELERYALLDLALQARRWDLFDLLLEWGADLKSAEVYTVLNTYNAELYERFRAAGYDLTERHEMASILGHGTSNRPLLGFVKRHHTEDSKIQQELNLALAYHVRAGNERGVNLCLWAGADPHAPANAPGAEVAQRRMPPLAIASLQRGTPPFEPRVSDADAIQGARWGRLRRAIDKATRALRATDERCFPLITGPKNPGRSCLGAPHPACQRSDRAVIPPSG
jgi:hypothetical protein